MSAGRPGRIRALLSHMLRWQRMWRRLGIAALAAWLIAGAFATPAFAQARKTPPPPRGASHASAPVVSQLPTRILDRLDEVGAWKTIASEGVTASLQAVVDLKRPALRLDFDLGGTAGYAIARRPLPLDLPANYALTFWLRADAPVNDLQLKLIDGSGDNVWWYHRRNFAFPSEWQQVTIKKRQIEFAWGPTKDRVLRHVASIEIVVAAGAGGGRGAVYVSDLALQELPEAPTTWPAPKVTASSSSPGSEAMYALDGDTRTAWRSDPKARREQWLTVDFGAPREFGGLALRFAPGEHASRYDVQFSDDAKRWRTVRRVTEGTASAALLLTESETRYLRLAFHDGPKRGYAVTELTVEDLAYGATANAFIAALARTAPRGTYPRAFSGEQRGWTLVGVDGGKDSGLLSEDGALEIGRNGFTIEPFVLDRGKAVGWPDVDPQPFLVDDDLPMPGVQWNAPDWSLRITTFGIGTEDDVQLVARYDLTNKTNHPLTLSLALAVRPFQVNPPSQSLNAPGGVSAINSLEWNGRSLAVNGTRTLYPLSAPARVALQPFDAGPLVPVLAASDTRSRRELHDESGFASGALIFPVTLAANAVTTLGIVVPLADRATPPSLTGRTPLQWLMREQAAAGAGWRGRLDRVTLRVPPEAQPLAD
ncbi:MAG TPA: discoidin domain-containing protein, partial [Casimicrobiaceae bacterium]|nr:discoidin domain-containing protein [Casimicrobiaceae bacterium]